jgi:hypothetical protein
MPYGAYDGPDKPNKGLEGGACNRSLCQHEPALHYNHGSYAWYCFDCSIDIGLDVVNKAGWDRDWKPRCGHDMFETREQMNSRKTLPAGSDLHSSGNQRPYEPKPLTNPTTNSGETDL